MGILLAGGTIVPDVPPLPLPTPRPSRPARAGIDAMTWTGWDGSEWDLLDPRGGVVMLMDEVRGLGMPEFTRHTTRAQSIPGTRWRGWGTTERDVFWPLLVFHDGSSRDWLLHNDALMGTFRPDKVGTWTVTTALGTRRLRCRFVEDTGGFTFDPAYAGWHVYGLSLVAEDPYWRATVDPTTWRADVARRAFLPAGGQLGLFLSSPYTVGAATVTNPGDVDAYPVHVLTGPITAGAKVGVAGSTITVPFAVASGDTLTIDTRPDRLTVTDSAGTSRFPDLTGDVGFPPIPAGTDVPIVVEFAGAGSITTTFEAAYFRGF